MIEALNVEHHAMHDQYYGMVEEGDLNAVQDLLAGWLSASALYLMALRELREKNIDQHIECSWYDESDGLNQYIGHKFNDAWPVCGYDTSPSRL